jgi:hypothetical protein
LDRGVLSFGFGPMSALETNYDRRLALGSVEKHDSTVLFQVFNPQIPLDLGTEVVHDA